MSGQSFFTGSNYQNANLEISSETSQNTNNSTSINVGVLCSDFLRNYIDVSFGRVDVSENILVNNNLTIG